MSEANELIDIYDENRELTGIRLPRKSRLAPGQYMLYVLALIENDDGRLLITRRSLDKKWAAGSWEIPGGGAMAGETSMDALCREAAEETGLTVDRSRARCIYTYRNDDPKHGDNYYADIYLCRVSFSMEDVKVQPSEVIDARLVSFGELTEIHEKDGFLHYERICQALGKDREIMENL